MRLRINGISFFVEKKKKEEKERQKIDKSFTKVYQKDKGKAKIGGVPAIKVIDNIPPPAQDTPPLTSVSLVHTESQPDKAIDEVTHDDTNPEFEILITMNVDT